jgi:hypothetical protein
LAFNEFDKNHRNDENKEQVMFENTDDPLCPVKSFQKYISKLNPSCEAFLQRPAAKFHKRDIWYVNAPLGIHTIATMLKNISSEAGLAHSYTNHCVKATTGTVLKKAGLANRDIMAVTGHKNVASLDSYIADPYLNERAKMSSILGSYGKDQSTSKVVAISAAPATVTSASDYKQVDTIDTGTNIASSSASQTSVFCANRAINVSDVAGAIFSGAHFMGPVTINVHVHNQ